MPQLELDRSFVIRDAEVKGRTIVLACVPFDTPAWVSDDAGTYREVWRRGAFTEVVKDPGRTKLAHEHSDRITDVFGVAQQLREDPHGLVGEFKVVGNDAGDHVLALARDGLIGGASVRALVNRVPEQDADGPLVARTRAFRLKEVSLTATPAFEDTGVLAVRAQADQVAADRRRQLAAAQERERQWWTRTAGYKADPSGVLDTPTAAKIPQPRPHPLLRWVTVSDTVPATGDRRSRHHPTGCVVPPPE